MATLVDDDHHGRRCAFVVRPTASTLADILATARNKLRLSGPHHHLVDAAGTVLSDGVVAADPGTEIFVRRGRAPAAAAAGADPAPVPGRILLLADRAEVERDAVEQLAAVAALPGVRLAAGMPDLHSGPTGCAVTVEGRVYPHLVGGDCGCGMAVFEVPGVAASRFHAERAARRARSAPPLSEEQLEWLRDRHGLAPGARDGQLGTIGGGNHFAEFHAVDRVVDGEALASLGLTPDALLLTVHTGSRGLGGDLFAAFECHGTAIDGEPLAAYLERAGDACRWARANRQGVALRLMAGPARTVLDITHNGVTLEEGGLYLHRKGAAPADAGIVVLPGSRGAASYLLRPTHCSMDRNGRSLAHGAGRRLSRRQATLRADKLTRAGGAAALTTTALGSLVVCDDADALREEIPEAYKDVEDVVADLAPFVDVVAMLRPLLTVKTLPA